MNCPNCQKPMMPGASFCSFCGSRVEAPQAAFAEVEPYGQQYQQQKTRIRQSEMNVLEDLIRYFSQKQLQYDAYDACCKNVIRFAKGCSSALVVWGSIVLGFGLLILLSELVNGSVANNIVPISMMMLLPGVLMLVGGILMKVNNKHKRAHYQQMYRTLSQELYHHYLGYLNCPVRPEYSNPQILHILLKNIHSGRCDSIKESINAITVDANYAEIAQYCQQIQQLTVDINANTGVGIVFADPRFFR